MNTTFGAECKKMILVLMAMFVLVACGGNPLDKKAEAYDEAVAKAEAASSSDELQVVDSELKAKIAGIDNEYKADLLEIVKESKEDTAAYKDDFTKLSTSQLKYEAAKKAAAERISKAAKK
ncbi:MAG: hypothetical protein IKJ95_08385 [Bacteroidaceae bacterium]|nr:hypothetical protein [Bacteroidaceae bacterium]